MEVLEDKFSVLKIEPRQRSDRYSDEYEEEKIVLSDR
jgi:hypothetical protein